MHSDEVAVEGAAADVDGAVGPSLAERDSISPGIGVRIAQEIDCPAGQIESAPTAAGAAAAQAEPAIVYQCPAIDRESADAPAANFNAAEANNRAAIQREGAIAASRRAHLEHIPVIRFTSTLSLDGEGAAADGEIARAAIDVAYPRPVPPLFVIERAPALMVNVPLLPAAWPS